MTSRFMLASLLFVAGCATAQSSVPASEALILQLGDHYATPGGNLFVLRIQDEYRVIRCTQEGPIKGCYEDVFSVAGDQVKFNRWMELVGMPGVQMALLSPTEVAFRTAPAAEIPR